MIIREITKLYRSADRGSRWEVDLEIHDGEFV
jgi:hypothetical protein